jgi:hypothetical protein
VQVLLLDQLSQVHCWLPAEGIAHGYLDVVAICACHSRQSTDKDHKPQQLAEQIMCAS